jgi:hypothetical protein
MQPGHDVPCYLRKMKKKIGGLEGRGILCVEGLEDLEVYYTIAVMKEPFRTATVGEGKVWADADELQSRAGPARLAIRGGDHIMVSLQPARGERFAPFVTQSPIPGF